MRAGIHIDLLNASQDYFRLMKFKYLEQHAKLDLMHNLTGEEGKILEPGENEEKGALQGYYRYR